MYQRMKMLLGGLILSTGVVVATPVSYAAETQVNGEEDIELAYENISKSDCNLSISGKEAIKTILKKYKKYAGKNPIHRIKF